MKSGTIIFTGKTKKGSDITLRYPKPSDLSRLLIYINTLSEEHTFITFQGEKITLADERKYLSSLLKKVRENRAVVLYALRGEELIGVCDICLQDKIEHHIGTFGITVAQEYRNEGVGSLLMRYVFQEAERQLSGLKIVCLGAFDGNEVAIKMYKKFGFTEYGRLPEGIFYKESYIDHRYMYKRMHG